MMGDWDWGTFWSTFGLVVAIIAGPNLCVVLGLWAWDRYTDWQANRCVKRLRRSWPVDPCPPGCLHCDQVAWAEGQRERMSRTHWRGESGSEMFG